MPTVMSSDGVHADRGRPHGRGRFANGSADGAEHAVSVGGTSFGTVTYPYTGWDNWAQAAVGVELTAGWNTCAAHAITDTSPRSTTSR